MTSECEESRKILFLLWEIHVYSAMLDFLPLIEDVLIIEVSLFMHTGGGERCLKSCYMDCQGEMLALFASSFTPHKSLQDKARDHAHLAQDIKTLYHDIISCYR